MPRHGAYESVAPVLKCAIEHFVQPLVVIEPALLVHVQK